MLTTHTQLNFPSTPFINRYMQKDWIEVETIDDVNTFCEKWKNDMRKLSTLENVFCKFSGILTEAGSNYDIEKIRPYTNFIFEIFESNRVMWGSDWPVLTLVETYQNWFDVAHDLVSGFSKTEKNDLFGGTAASFYKL